MNFAEHLKAAEMHWFFVQGVEAIERELFVPGVSSILNGIEASLRVTLTQLANGAEVEELSPYKVLSNTLINQAKDEGMPVEFLAFPNENDFLAKLATQKLNRIDVELVRQRNNICHGNIFEYINEELGEEDRFFTPECLRDTANVLIELATNWTTKLGEYRHARGL